MAEQIHKKFTDEQVKDLMKRYLKGELKRTHIQEVLNIRPTRFFALLKRYRNAPGIFSIQYKRSGVTRTIDPEIGENILKELKPQRPLSTTKTFRSGLTTIAL